MKCSFVSGAPGDENKFSRGRPQKYFFGKYVETKKIKLRHLTAIRSITVHNSACVNKFSLLRALTGHFTGADGNTLVELVLKLVGWLVVGWLVCWLVC